MRRKVQEELDDFKRFTIAALNAQTLTLRRIIDLMERIDESLELLSGRQPKAKRERFTRDAVSRSTPEDDFTPIGD